MRPDDLVQCATTARRAQPGEQRAKRVLAWRAFCHDDTHAAHRSRKCDRVPRQPEILDAYQFHVPAPRRTVRRTDERRLARAVRQCTTNPAFRSIAAPDDYQEQATWPTPTSATTPTTTSPKSPSPSCSSCWTTHSCCCSSASRCPPCSTS